MRGIRINQVVVLSLLGAVLAMPACKKGKDSDTAKEKRDPPPPSGTMSLQGMYSYMADAGVFVDCATQEPMKETTRPWSAPTARPPSPLALPCSSPSKADWTPGPGSTAEAERRR